MRTDGLNAFDAETRRSIERLLRPKEKVRERKQREYRAKKEPKPKTPRPEGVTTRAARLWLEHKQAGGTTTQRDWAKAYNVKETSMTSALFYLRNPAARAAKNEMMKARRGKRPSSQGGSILLK